MKSAEQQAALAEVTTAVSGLDAVVQQNAAAAEELSASASALKSRSEMLVESTSHFRLDSPNRSASRAASDFSRAGSPSFSRQSSSAAPTSFFGDEGLGGAATNESSRTINDAR